MPKHATKKSPKKSHERHSVSADAHARRAYEPAGRAANDPTNETRDEPAEADRRDAAEDDERTSKGVTRCAEDQERGSSEQDAPIERDADDWSRRASHDAKVH